MVDQVQHDLSGLCHDAVAALIAGGYPTARACELVAQPRSSWYHQLQQQGRVEDEQARAAARSRVDSEQPAALSQEERQNILDLLGCEQWQDLSVQQVYWTAFDADLVACSERTFYRVAAAAGLTGDRRRGKHSTQHGGASGSGRPAPVVAATAVNQLWSWDISALPGPGRSCYQLFLVMDVYSRFPIGFRVELDGSRHHAVDMFAQAFTAFGRPKVLHSDNGAQMRSRDLAELLDDVEQVVQASFSRPHVSDDNPFSEALFKTIKYDLDMPEFFATVEEARAWIEAYLRRYAAEHHHSGLANFTPEQVYTGQVETIHAQRQATLDKNYREHPERYRKPPRAKTPPGTVGINLSKTG